ITTFDPYAVMSVPVVVTVRAPGMPNIVVSQADFAPTQAAPSDPFLVSAFVENEGDAPARPFWVEVWGSRTGGLMLDRFLAPSVRLSHGLASGGSYSWVTVAPLESVPDGPYTVVYAADRPGEVSESNERDNRVPVRGKRLVVLRPQTKVDLVVEDFGMAPNPAVSGQELMFSGRVTNRGSQASGRFWIEFWGSYDHPYPTTGFFLCDSILVANLPAGGRLDLSSYQRRLYNNVPSGIFMVGCVVDRIDAINELDESNNYQFVDGQVLNRPALTARPSFAVPGAADLAVTSATFSPAEPVQVTPGTTVTFSVVVANRGAAESGVFWLEYWGSRDGGLTLSEFLALSDRVESLLPGATRNIVSPKTLLSVPDGPYTVVVVVDRLDELMESSEENNRFIVTGRRLLALRQPGDVNLALDQFAVSASGWPNITFGGVVRNTSARDSGPFWVEFWACPGDLDYPALNRFLCDSIRVNNVPAGGAISLSAYPRTSYALPPGCYSIIGFVDRPDHVNETDETDNYAIVRNFVVGQ
ncbi:hypothetical protein FJY63_06395, partial [Candidatus Sumerlaeota bacterium]|nr:hypothetical protein [Candidatus Sumerlaeota bacterium]